MKKSYEYYSNVTPGISSNAVCSLLNRVCVRKKKLKRFYYCFLNITEKYAFYAKATFEYN